MQIHRSKRFVAVFSVLVAALGWHLSWVTPMGSWQEATGWARIPSSDLPRAHSEGSPESSAMGPGPEIGWLGHAGFVLHWLGQTVILDPNTSGWCTLSKRALATRVDWTEIGPADAVLISHPHFDHLDLPTLRRISSVGGGIGSLVVPSGSRDYVEDAGVAAVSVVSLQPGGAVRLGPLEVIAVPAAHNGNRLHPFESKRLAVGYIVRSADFTLYYSGDTAFANSFEAIRDAYRPDLAILPIGAYLPRFPMRFYHLSPEEVVEAATILDVDTVIPAHFGTFALSLDRPAWALPRFARFAREKGVEWRMPRLVGEGATQASRARREGAV